MPIFGGAAIPEAVSDPFPGIEVELSLDTFVPNGDIVWDAFPLTFDETEGASATQADPTKVTLRDLVQGNEWRLRRLVGKAFIHAATATVGATGTSLADVALGFIVSKTYDDGSPMTDFSEVNPLSQNSMEDPWIWRRRWILNPHGQTVQTVSSGFGVVTDIRNTPAMWGFPQSTAGYGSVADGPHIDAKSNRTIHRSERLFGCLAARKYNQGGAVPYADSEVKMLLDYRILGSLKGQTYGNRGNMSR